MNYWDYIRVEDLLSLQSGFDRDESKVSNDECLFITVHQIYELWFKLTLRELTFARDLFKQNPVPDVALSKAVRSIRRVIVIFEQAAQHFRVIETLTTRDYLDFRDRLIPASGFQSAQLREIEILLGLEDSTRIPLGREGSYKEALKSADGSASVATKRVEARIADKPSLKQVIYDWLSRTPVDGPASQEASDAFLERIIQAHRGEIERRIKLAQRQSLSADDLNELRGRYEREIQGAAAFLRATDDPTASDEERAYRRRVRAGVVFLESYREHPRVSWPREAIDAIIEMEQAMVIWRQRHARMVERVIGRRTGTGGSAGVDYLDQTALKYRVFGDLWGVRSLLLRIGSLPTLAHPDEYAFRVEDKEL